MYQTDFICTYKLHDKDDQSDMYRIQLLQAFDMVEWNNDRMDIGMRNIFEQVGTVHDIQDILNKAKVSKMCEAAVTLIDADDFTIFSNLFQFDTFDLFHRCLSDTIRKGSVAEINKQLLLKVL